MARVPAYLFLSTLTLLIVPSTQAFAEGENDFLKERIRIEYGAPKSQLSTGSREILVYANGRIVLQQGVVVKNTLPKPKDPALKEHRLPQSISQAATSPALNPEVNATPQARAAQVAAVAVPEQPAEQKPEISQVSVIMGFLAAILALLALIVLGLMLWHSRRRMLRQAPASAPGVGSSPTSGLHQHSPPAAAAPAGPVSELGLALLQQLEWHRYELLITGAYSQAGYEVQRLCVGPDGSFDLRLSKAGSPKALIYAQGRTWCEEPLGLKSVRELYGHMLAEGAEEGILATSSDFSAEAKHFAEEKPLRLLTGMDIVQLIKELPEAIRAELLATVCAEDPTQPTCPLCGGRMTLRETASPFWSCPRIPPCRGKLHCRPDKTRFPL